MSVSYSSYILFYTERNTISYIIWNKLYKHLRNDRNDGGICERHEESMVDELQA